MTTQEQIKLIDSNIYELELMHRKLASEASRVNQTSSYVAPTNVSYATARSIPQPVINKSASSSSNPYAVPSIF